MMKLGTWNIFLIIVDLDCKKNCSFTLSYNLPGYTGKIVQYFLNSFQNNILLMQILFYI